MEDCTNQPMILVAVASTAMPPRIVPLHVVFVHLDLGIGGAEQLVLQLANASADLGHRVDLVTTKCEPTHCFASVKPGGRLHSSLHVWGRWVPHDLLGVGRTLCSTVRLLYLSYLVARTMSPDLIILDVLSTPLPLLSSSAPTLFYCHFPDKLLKQKRRRHGSKLGQLYHVCMNAMEEATMQSSDIIAVNSNFTRTTVLNAFPSLCDWPLRVLYPALDRTSLDRYEAQHPKLQKHYRLVSLNRYERKKNIELFLHAMDWARTNQPRLKLPEIVIAGGYDIANVENVEYRAELEQTARALGLAVEFRQSISDEARAELLFTSLAVVYTPDGEHFGIVPLEAMYAKTPVVAVDSGGPKESILHGKTGYLCPGTAEGFGRAFVEVLNDPSKANAMGIAGRKSVLERFGDDRLLEEWKTMTSDAIEIGRRRMRSHNGYRVVRGLLYVIESAVVLLVAVGLTWFLRLAGVLDSDESLLGGVRKMMGRDEL